MAEMRKCVGSTRFGFEPHDAPVEDFPKQPSQKDGIGRMCAVHWRLYTAGLAKDAKARKVAGAEPSVTAVTDHEADAPAAPGVEAPVTEPEAEAIVTPPVTEPATKRTRRTKVSVADGEVGAG